MSGKLYLVPSFLGETDAGSVFPEINREVVSRIHYFIVEEERTARRFLKKIVPSIIIDDLTFFVLNEHTREEEILHYLDAAAEGNEIALLSEAGMPCVADPGAMVVRLAHETGVPVIPLVGPSSVFLSLAASGFNGQSFAFHGYLPIDKVQRARKIRELEMAVRSGQTQIFIETPYRNTAMFEALLQTCRPDTLLCIGCDITMPTESIVTSTISSWKKRKPDLHKRPAVFLLGQ